LTGAPKAILGTTPRCRYADGGHAFELKNSSGLFQPKIRVRTALQIAHAHLSITSAPGPS
jgi:hypothetical protein